MDFRHRVISYESEFGGRLPLQISQIIKFKSIRHSQFSQKQSDRTRQTNSGRNGFSTLIQVVLDVHNRDVVDQFIADNIQSAREFAWLSQLRYCQEEKRGAFFIPVKCINAVYNYGFEYLGNSTRLLI